MKSEHLDVLNTHCAWCDGELPIEAPVTAKYCCPECRWAAMQAKNQEENAVRRKLRQKRKAAIGPRFCLHCGKEIPSTANLHRKFCGVACCDDFHNAKRHAKIRPSGRLCAKPPRRDIASIAARCCRRTPRAISDFVPGSVRKGKPRPADLQKHKGLTRARVGERPEWGVLNFEETLRPRARGGTKV